MGRLLIISNRLPYTIDRSGEDIVVRQSSGGLVSAIKSCLERTRAQSDHFTAQIWMGSLDASKEDWKILNDMDALESDFSIEPVFVDKEIYDAYYNGFANSILWPLFHYFPSLVEYKKEYFQAYKLVNQAFADALNKIYQPGDVIWVHDYQLMALPQLFRQYQPDAAIGFFLHIPFPSYELFRLLPSEWRQYILLGLLGADLIGFHTHDYVQHFIQSVKMLLRVETQYNSIYYNDRIIKADLFPIGIDYRKFRDAITDEAVVTICTRLEEKFYDKKLIFSVDRLDYTKGLDHRLKSFEEFLERYPEWRGKVVFIFNVVPSRKVIPAYVDRKRKIEEQVSTINGRFSSLDWQPLIYRFNHLSFEELCALYQTADVALITPLRDGMNLVAKEYVASCIDKGVLILSELTGAASELSEAILVNPTDSEEVATSINTALTMPLTEQRYRLSYMQKRLAEYDVKKWINDFLDQLAFVKGEQDKLKVDVLDIVTIDKMMNEFSAASKRCILLDYDGTLIPYQKLPNLAVPSKDVLELLDQLSKDENNEIVVISGRDTETLEKWLGHLPINLVSEHGACLRIKNEDWQTLATSSPEWKEEIRPILQLFVTRCAGSFIEEKKNTIAWHYRNTSPDLGFIRSRELFNNLRQLITNTPLQVVDGNKVIEVRMIGLDKGSTALNMVARFNPDFTLCIGDDTTDEDMFRILRDKAFTIKVGSGNTSAQYKLLHQRDVLPLLRRFVMPVKSKNLEINA
ncbi:bifunctional alpha,alpha-trehalose-phosphate synthase (UDP-forming)/trehalose-phosphatase [Chitinophagaceae bacterium LB-8]|uniref:Bifunctional alpha,alpha-trehalose-phosphate synthase (UDP-forming)/trehalose-phosphatase n=1 Tax=Paraflavisolibacter caeni TaxID=2982496 RepID=A0A9X2XXF8_9BACT|nr:bifunctional alpha,alpha-trehalose-phosphate synthase (UDP-forming)/trehalose-phosphatase [Paraflavisolibacter caeni]MCU7550337.1 bifunctional alpha,alpha-trehalose-phosphate synthase (UDP-forming)/trehalose-phosphatase [Paraflavisolibacter caeni]